MVDTNQEPISGREVPFGAAKKGLDEFVSKVEGREFESVKELAASAERIAAEAVAAFDEKLKQVEQAGAGVPGAGSLLERARMLTKNRVNQVNGENGFREAKAKLESFYDALKKAAGLLRKDVGAEYWRAGNETGAIATEHVTNIIEEAKRHIEDSGVRKLKKNRQKGSEQTETVVSEPSDQIRPGSGSGSSFASASAKASVDVNVSPAPDDGVGQPQHAEIVEAYTVETPSFPSGGNRQKVFDEFYQSTFKIRPKVSDTGKSSETGSEVPKEGEKSSEKQLNVSQGSSEAGARSVPPSGERFSDEEVKEVFRAVSLGESAGGAGPAKSETGATENAENETEKRKRELRAQLEKIEKELNQLKKFSENFEHKKKNVTLHYIWRDRINELERRKKKLLANLGEVDGGVEAGAPEELGESVAAAEGESAGGGETTTVEMEVSGDKEKSKVEPKTERKPSETTDERVKRYISLSWNAFLKLGKKIEERFRPELRLARIARERELLTEHGTRLLAIRAEAKKFATEIKVALKPENKLRTANSGELRGLIAKLGKPNLRAFFSDLNRVYAESGKAIRNAARYLKQLNHEETKVRAKLEQKRTPKEVAFVPAGEQSAHDPKQGERASKAKVEVEKHPESAEPTFTLYDALAKWNEKNPGLKIEGEDIVTFDSVAGAGISGNTPLPFHAIVSRFQSFFNRKGGASPNLEDRLREALGLPVAASKEASPVPVKALAEKRAEATASEPAPTVGAAETVSEPAPEIARGAGANGAERVEEQMETGEERRFSDDKKRIQKRLDEINDKIDDEKLTYNNEREAFAKERKDLVAELEKRDDSAGDRAETGSASAKLEKELKEEEKNLERIKNAFVDAAAAVAGLTNEQPSGTSEPNVSEEVADINRDLKENARAGGAPQAPERKEEQANPETMKNLAK